jgi:two-component system, chemotaxis family, protein-glutamate methylesterase/glutaminase
MMTNNIKIVVIGGSAGSFNVVRKILSSVPEFFPLPMLLCLHRLRDYRNGFAESLNIDSRVRVIEPHDKDPLKAGFIYLAPSNYHMMIEPDRSIALSTEPHINYSRPSLDITFETAGYAFRNSMAGIILSGANGDGAKGMYSAYREGAFTMIQDPADAQFGTMPMEVLKYFTPHTIMKEEEIVIFINSLKDNVYA